MSQDNTNSREGFDITERTTPISKAKEPLPLDEARAIRERFSVPNWQSAGDDGVYINLHFPSFHPTDVVMPTHAPRALERNIHPDLPNMTYSHADGSQSDTLDGYVNGDNRTQAVMMAHKGKVVYEAYPGMNPTDYHIWMSTSKTVVGTLCMMLVRDGLMDLEAPVTKYATQLAGSPWDNVSLRNALNMSSGLDIEETTEAFLDPTSWIEQFFASLFGDNDNDWIQILRDAKPIEGEKPGDLFRYSTAITQVLVLASETASNLKFADLFNQRIWSKIGAYAPFMVGLAADGTAVGGGMNMTTPEDMLRYAMIYTPSWNVVSEEPVIDDELLKNIQTLGDPAAYKGCIEEQYHPQWFGEGGERNSAQWDCVFADGAMFKHGNMHQGIYVDPARDFCAMTFSTTPNDRPDYTPGYLRAAAKLLAGG
ncbi:CubicO group peptidase (beta-lactamase class C family) [Aliiruegeria haliotis]|uniref:CubicO group peptidase (Beta-lactamase class C family) n=1 Tax=Aliiruegeria haliotis TaxID=1280846 RepID=A0A2T0RGJ0_9RHOB|nr:serine hydrolase domain-containing protein [Aliiruegeria haliotis]PRY20220.1 CubicO group peptidase (beta-lactamase class C family) [Aliiruegeria haliotis]